MNCCHPAMIFDMLIGEGEVGGVALIYKEDISFRNIVTTNEITQFELLDCIIKLNKTFYKSSCGVQTPSVM